MCMKCILNGLFIEWLENPVKWKIIKIVSFHSLYLKVYFIWYSLFPDRSDLPCGGTIDRKQIAERIFQQVKGSWVELQNGGCSVGNRQFILCIREGTTCGHICGKYCIYFLGKMWSKDCFIWKELLQRATCVVLWKVELLLSC